MIGRWGQRVALALVLAGIVAVQGRAMSQGPAKSLRPAVQLALHGNTPSLSWSPDSTRVVVNAAYTYYGSEPQIEAHRGTLGIYVVEAANGRATKVGPESGYHPLWLDAREVAWGHSAYEDGQPGLYRSPADRSAPVRVGSAEGVNHTLLAKKGGVLYYAGWPEDPNGWAVMNVSSGQSAPAGIDQGSWTVPALAVDQCPQKVGGAAIVKAGEGWAVVAGGGRALLPGEAFRFTSDYPPGSGGIVRACLSPDGKSVAWFVQEPDGYGLRIAPTR